MFTLLTTHGAQIAAKLEALLDYAGSSMCGECETMRVYIRGFHKAQAEGDNLLAYGHLQEMTEGLRGLLERYGPMICGQCFGSHDELAQVEALIADVAHEVNASA
ncbi:MAG: hypothetical protein KDB07_09525 [Planctomycetes bacterium]|nr:hypothetical protein [Planctomycetota bacterium]